MDNAQSDGGLGVASKKRNVREYTLGEEIANSITHGIGAGLAIAALVLLIVKSVFDGGGIYLAAALIYGICLLIEYLMSTLYHALAPEGAKRVFKVLDHSCIYLLIAGTYTPYCLITLEPNGGFWLFIAVWVMALIGVACEAFWTFRPRWVSAAIYVIMGWCIVAFLPALFSNMDSVGFWLLLSGGLSYTVGAVFYIFKKVKFMHSIFHLFVLAGSILQFFSIYFFVIRHRILLKRAKARSAHFAIRAFDAALGRTIIDPTETSRGDENVQENRSGSLQPAHRRQLKHAGRRVHSRRRRVRQ